MQKPSNPATLGAQGVALLKRLAEPQLLFHIDYEAAWCGEPLTLPASHYKVEPTPSGLSILGWRLTEAGARAWRGALATD
jgi:hypothetical protein